MRRCCCCKVEIRISTSFKRAPVFLAANLQNLVEIISNLLQTSIHYLYHESRNNTRQSSSSSKISSVLLLLLLLCCCCSSLTSRKLELQTSNKNHIFHETDLFCTSHGWNPCLQNSQIFFFVFFEPNLSSFSQVTAFFFFFLFRFLFCLLGLLCFVLILYLFICFLGSENSQIVFPKYYQQL